jgi:hypothetical protein
MLVDFIEPIYQGLMNKLEDVFFFNELALMLNVG